MPSLCWLPDYVAGWIFQPRTLNPYPKLDKNQDSWFYALVAGTKTKRARSAEKRPTRDQVARLTRRGLKPREIAEDLGISTQAVYQHLRTIAADSEAVG